MKILKHGTKAVDRTYTHTCVCCYCIFEYCESELSSHYYDPRESVLYWYVVCPECGDSTGFVKPTVKLVR